MIQTRQCPVLQEDIHHLIAQSISERAQMQSFSLVTEQTDFWWVENIDGTVGSTVKYREVGLHSSITDDRLHPEKELSILQPGMSPMNLSIPEIYEMNNLHLSTRCWTPELHMTHRNTSLVWSYPSVPAPGDSWVTSDCPEATFTVAAASSTGFPSWSLIHL